MLNEPMNFTDINLASALRKAEVWLNTYYYTATHCLVARESLGDVDFWRVEIIYRTED